MSTHLMTFLPLRHLLADRESLRFVDDHFQPEDRTGLAVHLEPVLFHTMFDPRPGNALEGEIGNIGNDFSFELGADLFSKKARKQQTAVSFQRSAKRSRG